MQSPTQARPDMGKHGHGCWAVLTSPCPPSLVLPLPVDLAKPLEPDLSLMSFCGDPTMIGPHSKGTAAGTILIPMPKYHTSLCLSKEIPAYLLHLARCLDM